MIYLIIIDIIRLSFVSKRLNETAYVNKQFRNYWKPSNTVINKRKLCDCFLERFDGLIDRFDFYFNFTDVLFVNYCL